MTSKPNDNDDQNHSSDSVDSAELFGEVTVVRPRSTFDDAFDAHTVIRPAEAKRGSPAPSPKASAQTDANTGDYPPPPPIPAPPQVSNTSFNDEVTRIGPSPLSSSIPMPPPAPKVPTGPSAAEIEAQALAIAQERARMKAQQAAEQAMQKAAAAQAEAARRNAEEAARETARRTNEEAQRENARRQLQAVREAAQEDVKRREAGAVSPPSSAPHSVDEESVMPMEPARRQISWKWPAIAIFAVGLGFYFSIGTGTGTNTEAGSKSIGQAVTKTSPKSSDLPAAVQPATDDGTDPAGGAIPAQDVKSIQTLLSAFDDAFSRSQVRARPESQD